MKQTTSGNYKGNHSTRINWITIGAIVMTLVGLVIRMGFIFNNRVPLNSDEAVVGLMAKHILQGERPTFFYGQAYMGSLDAWFNAICFKLLGGINLNAMRITQLILWVGLLISIFFLAKELFRSQQAGWLALLLMANPVVNVVLYTTASLGGYQEAIIIGLWGQFVALRITRQSDWRIKSGFALIFLFGLLFGLGLWAFAFALVFTIPALFFILWNLIKVQRSTSQWMGIIVFMVAGAILGSLPWWIYAIQNGFSALIIELTGSAVAVETGSWISRVGAHLLNFTLLGISVIFGFRAPWSVDWIILPVIPLVIFAWFWVLRGLQRNGAQWAGLSLPWLTISFNIFAFVVLSFGVDPSGRYFLPISVMLAVLSSGGLLVLNKRSQAACVMAIIVLVGYAISGTIIAVNRSPAGLTTQFAPNTEPDHASLSELIDFLHENGIDRGYTDYWVSYPLAFLSNEELIFTPELPYHRDFRYTSRDNRYPGYNHQVDQADRPAYIIDNFPELSQRIRDYLTIKGVDWREAKIGKFDIFYALSEKIKPVDFQFIVHGKTAK